MPAQPAWFHRLAAILETLRCMESYHLDRRAVQKLFGVRERRARQIMAGLPGLQVGNAFAVERLALIGRLEETAAGEPCQWEVNRRARVVEDLDRTRRELVARQVSIPAPANVESRRLWNLSSDIGVKRGELRIEFSGAEDLAAKLFELSQVMANDWDAFSRAVEDTAR